MRRETHIRNCEDLQAYSAAHVAVCRCLRSQRSRNRPSDPGAQEHARQQHIVALAALFELLQADLRAVVRQWLLRALSPELIVAEDRRPVLDEVEQSLVLNIFTAVVHGLEPLALDARTNVYDELLALARRSLYTYD